MNLETFTESCNTLAIADVRLFFKLIESQGYDLWLTKAAFPTYKYKHCVKNEIQIHLLEMINELVERKICCESPVVAKLKANKVKLISMIGQHVTSVNSEPINYYDDRRLEDDYPEMKEKLTLTDVRYYYGILRNFNKYFASSVPYINN